MTSVKKLVILLKSKHTLLYDSVTQLLGIYLREKKPDIQQSLIEMFIVTTYWIAK